MGGGDSGDARKEMSKTKEQLGEEKKIALSIRIKPLQLDAMDSDELKAKAQELHGIVIALETDKYDYEQKKINQERDLQELKERQKAQLRQKALKKGLDPESLDAAWKEKYEEWSKRPSKKLPKWFGERPGKKAGDAPTPEGEEEGEAEAAAEEEEEEYDEEEEEEEEEE